MTMVRTKLERSFNTEELHQMLSMTFQDRKDKSEEGGAFGKIERPPMPPGSSIFEQAKGELEIEQQSEKNGTATLPAPSQPERGHSGRHRLNVPRPSPVPSRRGSNLSRHNNSRHNSPRRSPSPFGLAPNHFQSGRRSPFLQVPSTSRPSSARSNGSGPRSRPVSPR